MLMSAQEKQKMRPSFRPAGQLGGGDHLAGIQCPDRGEAVQRYGPDYRRSNTYCEFSKGISGGTESSGVIPPFLTGSIRRIHAAIFSFWAV